MASKLKFKKSGTVYEAPLSTNKNAAAPAWIGIRDSVGVKYVAMWGLASGKVKYPLRIRKGGVTYGAGDHVVATPFTVELTTSGGEFVIPSDAYNITVTSYLRSPGAGGAGGGGGGGIGGTLTVTGTGTSVIPGGCGGGGTGGSGGNGGNVGQKTLAASPGDMIRISYIGNTLSGTGGSGGYKGADVTREASGKNMGNPGSVGGSGSNGHVGVCSAISYVGSSTTFRDTHSVSGVDSKAGAFHGGFGYPISEYTNDGGKGGDSNNYEASNGGNATYTSGGAGGAAGSGSTNGYATSDWRYSRGGDGGAGGAGGNGVTAGRDGVIGNGFNGSSGAAGTAGYARVVITYTRDI